MTALVFVLLIVFGFTQFENIKGQDPCSDDVYTTIEGENNRSPDYKMDPGAEVAYSDDRLNKGWFRILNDAGDDMPTTAPEVLSCGTFHPIWLQGTLPTSIGVTQSESVCLVGYDGTCTRTWDINIRKCTGDYFVYELTPSPITDSGYCFGSSSLCPNGTSSETGYTPCSSQFPSDIFSPSVQPDLEDGNQEFFNTGVYNVEPVFKCSFSDTGNTYFYDVHWFINGNSVKVFKNVQYTNIAVTYLRPRHWEAAYDMNMEVKCSVRARNTENSVPSPHHRSASFIAGVVADSYLYDVDEGSSIKINITATVPLGCRRRIDLGSCRETIKLSFPLNQSCIYDNNGGQTTGIVVEQSCGVVIYGHDWAFPRTLNVYGNIDNLYNHNSVKYASISLRKAESFNDRSKAWDKLIIPDIKVYIKDKDADLQFKICESYTDPNYLTFDQKRYSSQISGEYVLYRHKREPYWIHTISSRCLLWGTCNVGIAIRSHDTIFVVRTVDELFNPLEFDNTDHDYTATISGRAYPFIEYRHCDDQNMKIKRTGKTFTVTLPSGTEIKFGVKKNTWRAGDNLLVVNPITIKPSLLDIQQTEGLCGTLTFDTSDDFQERSSDNIVLKDPFLRSWSISQSSDESLFKANVEFVNNFPFRPFCVCGGNENHGTNGVFSNLVHCNLTQPKEQCYSTETTSSGDDLYSICSNGRNAGKRSLDNSDEVIDTAHLRYSPDFVDGFIPKEPEWRFGWTEVRAQETCTQAFTNLSSLALCQKFAGTDLIEYVTSCMTDIRITGGTELLQGAIETMLSSCLIEVSRNETLMITSSDESNEQSGFTGSLLDSIKAQMCINNCSSNGICDATTSTCICNNEFLGDDCSEPKSTPPQNYKLPAGGKCGIKSRSCQKTFVYGIFETDDVWCRLTYFQIVENEKETTGHSDIMKAEYQSPNAISCPLTKTSSRRRKRSVDIYAEGYDISLSYDGKNFGEGTSIIIYDEQCYSCNSTSLSCSILSACQSSSTPADSSNTEKETSGEKGMVSVIIASVVGGLLLIVLCLVCAYFKWCKSNSSTDEEEVITNNPPPYSTHISSKKAISPPCYDSQVRSLKPPTYSSDVERPASVSTYLSLDVTWADERPLTPDHLFVPLNLKQQ